MPACLLFLTLSLGPSLVAQSDPPPGVDSGADAAALEPAVQDPDLQDPNSSNLDPKDSTHHDPLAEPTPGRDLLTLAEELAEAGRLEAAIEVYQDLVESPHSALRKEALEGLQALLEEERGRQAESKRWHKKARVQLWEGVAATGGTVLKLLPSIGMAWLLALALQKLAKNLVRKNDLRVAGFDQHPQNPIFQDLVFEMADLLKYHFSAHRGIASLSNAGEPPSFRISVRSEQLSAYMGEMLVHLSKQSASWIGSWLKRLDRSEFLLEGTMETQQDRRHAILCLKRNGKLIDCWERDFPVSATTDGLRDLAYLALIRLQQVVRTEHARSDTGS